MNDDGVDGGEQRVLIRGVDLAVESTGRGRPFIWTHGLVSCRAQESEVGLFPWDLAGHARVIRYDARGHGRSGATGDPGDYRWENLALDLLAVADATGCDRFVAGGASMGVGLALHAAVAAPERVEGLVLVLPPAAWEDRPRQAEVYEKMAGILEAKGAQRLAELMGDQPPYPFVARDVPEATEVFRRYVARWDADVVPLVLRGAARTDLPPPERLRDLAVPAVILTWPGDPGHPDESARRLHEALPRSELHVADGIDAVRGWRGLVATFLDALP